MKQFIFTTLFAFFFITNGAYANHINKAEPCTIRINLCIQIVGTPTSKKSDCVEPGLSCLRVLKCRLVEGNSLKPSEAGTSRLLISNISNSEYSVTFLGAKSTKFTLEEDFLMPEEVSKAFEKRSITFLKGVYPIKDNRDGSFTVILRAL